MPRSCFPLYPDRSLPAPCVVSSSLVLSFLMLFCLPSHHLPKECHLLCISSYLWVRLHILALLKSLLLHKCSSCDCPYRNFFTFTSVYSIARNSSPYFCLFLFLSLSLYCFTSSDFLMCCCLLSMAFSLATICSFTCWH